MNMLVEKVARACCEAGHHLWPDTDGYNDRAEKNAWRAIALAALKAMREPTEAMKVAACVEADKHGFYHTRGYFDVEEADYAWRSMIDAAIQEHSTTPPRNAS